MPEVRIPLLARNGDTRAWTSVDAADAADVNRWTWRLVNGYAGRVETHDGKPRSIYLHRYLLGLEYGDDLQVDHVNRRPLDNRRANLRLVTPAQQAQNKKPRSDSRSGLRGVCWVGKRSLRPWQGRVQVRGVVYRSPCMESAEEAADWAAAMRASLMTHAEEAACPR